MIVLLIVALLAITVLTLIVFGLLRTHADILRALDRAGISLDDSAATSTVGPVQLSQPTRKETAIDIVGTVPGGGPVSVSVGGADHTLLAFLSSGCRTCGTFWSEFKSPVLELGGEAARLVIVAQDPAHDSESRLVELAPNGVRTVCSTAAWEAYGVPGSPYFVLIDGHNRRVVGSGTATNWPQVRRLLAQAIGDAKSSGAKSSGAKSSGAKSSGAHSSGAHSSGAKSSGAHSSGAHSSGAQSSGAHSNNGVDAELAAFGIGPGHPSLYPPEGASPLSPEDDT